MDLMEVLGHLSDESAMQKLYFGHAAFARLCAHPQHQSVHWKVFFQDLGMMHIIKGKAIVQERDGGFIVNNHRVRSLQDAADRVYKGRFQRALRAIYRKLGVKTDR